MDLKFHRHGFLFGEFIYRMSGLKSFTEDAVVGKGEAAVAAFASVPLYRP